MHTKPIIAPAVAMSENLRRFFEMDRNHIAGAALAALADDGEINRDIVADAVRRYGIVATDAAPWEA